MPQPAKTGDMTWSVAEARNLVARCRQLRDAGQSEAVLRAEFQSWLRRVFPDPADEAWVNHYSEGAEAHTTVGMTGGGAASRFVDTLIRSTVIEYEADLRQTARRDRGRGQVREYIAGVIRSGTPVSLVRGVLSDTVDWYVFDAELESNANPSTCTPADVILHEIEFIVPTATDEDTARRFGAFLRKHLAREQSRALTSTHLAGDLGLESSPFRRHVETLLRLVEEGRRTDPSIALATDLWSRFVDSLEREPGAFRAPMYVDEAYIAVLARLLAANVLQGRALLSDDDELAQILTGEYFSIHFRLKNMVEDDYFGWAVRAPHLDQLMPVAREIQRDLYAYDFSHRSEEDLFGRLMAQLARRSQRKLLGQEWTPTWLARALASRCLDLIPDGERPQIVDVACGSGSILAEIIKEALSRNPAATLDDLVTAATGFDIDPLAVVLAKTTWVVTLSAHLSGADRDVLIPVYHADSLFALTPVSRQVPALGEAGDFVIELDGTRLTLPSELINPDFRGIFDAIVDWAYDEARAAAESNALQPTQGRAETLIGSLIESHGIVVTQELASRIAAATFALAARMAELARARRNGIWAFILRNTYRPGLLAGQFNGLVSNPPWLAMSQLADNPYKEHLSTRAQLYGIKPAGASHLHLELATTYLLHAIDRYLKSHAAIACLVPGTIFNGHHHQKFRDAAYLTSSRIVPFELRDIWEVAAGTFKVRSAAVVGVKRPSIGEVHSAARGFHVHEGGLQEVTFEVLQLGSRSAWVLAGNAAPLGAPTTDEVPDQGADLMPRTTVCIEILEQAGAEWRVRTPPPSSPLHFAVKDAKKLEDKSFAGVVAPQFIFRMVQSLNMLPFVCIEPFAPIAIPARRLPSGQWEILDSAAIRTAGFLQTSRRFERIDRALVEARVVKRLAEKINERNKLTVQMFPEDQYLVLNGAGGGVSCAACLPIRQQRDVVIDQTLYWRLAPTATEAWYRVGLLNSDAITQAIRPFNPQGAFGARHLHTLPHRVIPIFDPANEDHQEIAAIAERLAGLVRALIDRQPGLGDPNRAITARRRRLRTLLRDVAEYQHLEELCAAVLGTTPGGAN